MNNPEMMDFGRIKLKILLNLLRIGEKNSDNRKQYREDGLELEPRLSERADKICRKKTLLRSSNDDEKHHQELLRHTGMKNGKVEPTMKRIWKILQKPSDWWWFILTSNFEKNLRIPPEKLEESGKILGKDPWVRAHSKETHSNDYLKGRLHRLN